MAAKLIYLIFILSVAVCSKGKIIEKAINYIEELAENTRNANENLQNLAETGKFQLEQKFKTLKLQTQENAVQNLQKVKKFASDNPTICSPDVHAALDKLNLELYKDSRWEECMDLSKAVLDFSQYIHSLVSNFDSVELLFCNGIQNVSACEGTFLDKWHCATVAIKDFVNSLFDNKGDFAQVVKEVNQALMDIIAKGIECFSGMTQRFTNNLLELVKTKCNVPADALQLQ